MVHSLVFSYGDVFQWRGENRFAKFRTTEVARILGYHPRILSVCFVVKKLLRNFLSGSFLGSKKHEARQQIENLDRDAAVEFELVNGGRSLPANQAVRDDRQKPRETCHLRMGVKDHDGILLLRPFS